MESHPVDVNGKLLPILRVLRAVVCADRKVKKISVVRNLWTEGAPGGPPRLMAIEVAITEMGVAVKLRSHWRRWAETGHQGRR
jgi:hypothetical protein